MAVIKPTRNSWSTMSTADYQTLQSTAGSTAPTMFPINANGKTVLLAQFDSTSTAHTSKFTVKAGDEGLAWQRGQGDLTLTGANLSTGTHYRVLGPFESARFVQAADSTATNVASTGLPVIKVGYELSTTSTGTVSGTASVAVLQMPEIEYTT